MLLQLGWELCYHLWCLQIEVECQVFSLCIPSFDPSHSCGDVGGRLSGGGESDAYSYPIRFFRPFHLLALATSLASSHPFLYSIFWSLPYVIVLVAFSSSHASPPPITPLRFKISRLPYLGPFPLIHF